MTVIGILTLDENCGNDDAWRLKTPNDATDLTINVG